MRLSIISVLVFLLAYPLSSHANDEGGDTLTYGMKKYESIRKVLKALVPSQAVVQNAGNMGLVSCGIGWNYGKRDQWETHLMAGYIPKHKSSVAKITVTLKENFIPWNIVMQKGWSFEPLSCGMYLNAIFGKEFWSQQPNRYPNNYYTFSTQIRVNAFLGQRMTRKINWKGFKLIKSATVFYEVSSCDIYIFDYIINHSVGLKDMLGLSVGVKLQLR